MPRPFTFVLGAAATLALAGCSLVEQRVPGPHLVYRDASGAPTMQVDYPTKEMCLRVEEVAAKNAKCQLISEAGKLHARAVLWYNPPDMEVEAYYTDVASCQHANSRMARCVHLQKPCASR